jgi:hypothetical protein
VDATTEKRTDGEYDRRRFERNTSDGNDTAHRLALHQKIAGLLLKQREVWLVLEDGSDRLLIELAICLSARGAYSRSLTGVEGSKLNSRSIRGTCHDAAEGVYLSDQVALTDSTDGWIAAHLAERFDALGQEESAHAHACSRQCRFRTGMATADDDHVKGLGETHRSPK